jgi:hypothetical protein
MAIPRSLALFVLSVMAGRKADVGDHDRPRHRQQGADEVACYVRLLANRGRFGVRLLGAGVGEPEALVPGSTLPRSRRCAMASQYWISRTVG